METPPVANFRRRILEGAWDEAEEALTELGMTEENGLVARTSIFLRMRPPNRLMQQSKLLILQQKYLELLEQGETTRALHVLRSELVPLHPDPSQFHPLSRYSLPIFATGSMWTDEGLVLDIWQGSSESYLSL